MSAKRHFRVWRGDANGGELEDYQVEVNEGEVVLDVIHRLQATQAPDLACRWNCKAGKCGSCSMEINGMPKLGCMARMSTFAPDETVTVTPLRTFPIIRDLVTDVSFNYTKAREMPAVMTDVAPADRRHYPTRPTPQRADLPDRAGVGSCGCRCEVDQRARVGRPARIQVINAVARQLQWRTAGQETDPDVALAPDHGDEGHHPAVG